MRPLRPVGGPSQIREAANHMAKTIRRTTTTSASADELLATLVDPASLEHRHLAQGAIEAKVHEVERSDSRLVQRVEAREYGHKKTGGVDRSRVEHTETRYQWDLAARRCRWTYHGPEGGRVHIEGTFAVHVHGAGSALETQIDVRVDVPLIGRMIEGLIASDIEKFLETYQPPSGGGKVGS